MRLMLSEAVLMSTLQSRSTRRGRETVNKTAQLRAPVPLKLMSLHCVKAVLSVARSPAFLPQEWGARSPASSMASHRQCEFVEETPA